VSSPAIWRHSTGSLLNTLVAEDMDAWDRKGARGFFSYALGIRLLLCSDFKKCRQELIRQDPASDVQ
jgi:hypothetical protein